MRLRCCMVAASALFVALPVVAQPTIGVGVNLGLVMPSDDVGSTITFGGQGIIQNLFPSVPEIVAAPSFSYWSSDFDGGGDSDASFSEFGINFDARYMFPMQGAIDLFAGAGLGMFFSSVDLPEVVTQFGTFGGGSASDTDIGFNLLGGATTAASPKIDLTGQFRFKLDGVDTIQILAGAVYNFTK